MGLPYPGGPFIDKLAEEGDSSGVIFPRVFLDDKSYDFSFSGLKTAVLNHLNQLKQWGEEPVIADIAASFQDAVLDVLVEKTFRLAKEMNRNKIAIAGGVAANKGLRGSFKARGEKERIEIFYPSTVLCTDNAAMIGSAGYFNFISGIRSTLDLKANPNLGFLE